VIICEKHGPCTRLATAGRRGENCGFWRFARGRIASIVGGPDGNLRPRTNPNGERFTVHGPVTTNHGPRTTDPRPCFKVHRFRASGGRRRAAGLTAKNNGQKKARTAAGLRDRKRLSGANYKAAAIYVRLVSIRYFVL